MDHQLCLHYAEYIPPKLPPRLLDFESFLLLSGYGCKIPVCVHLLLHHASAIHCIVVFDSSHPTHCIDIHVLQTDRVAQSYRYRFDIDYLTKYRLVPL